MMQQSRGAEFPGNFRFKAQAVEKQELESIQDFHSIHKMA